MKGMQGLAVAAVLGILGAFCNWFYLAQQARNLATIEFIGVAPGSQINPGDKIKLADLVPISIPSGPAADSLGKSAIRYRDVQTVVGMPSTKSYGAGEIILAQDLKTPPQQDIKRMLNDNERAIWVPVDSRMIVSSLINAGDFVSFVTPRTAPGTPPAAPPGVRVPQALSAGSEVLGPFRVLSLGNRMGSSEVSKATGMSTGQENVIALAVKVVNNELDDLSQRLTELVRSPNYQQSQVILHPVPPGAKPRG